MNPPPIKIPVEIKIQDLWGEAVFQGSDWWPINFLVGANGTGKTRFADALKGPLGNAGLKPRVLGADRLSGLQRGNIFGHGSAFDHGLNIGHFRNLREYGANEGRAADAFIILKTKLDVRIRLEALLITFFKRRLRLSEEGGFLKPKLQRIHGGSAEYELKEDECHGLKELLALLSFIYDDEFNCLIIDEPELNLHPQFQSFLLSEIRQLAADPTTQPGKKMFFLITHSPYLLDFRTIDELRSLLLFQPDQIPRRLGSLTQGDEYRLRRLLPRLNTHHKQFFFASRPIFVEGYRDQQLFTLIQERRGRLLGITGACFIDVNGKDEQDLFYRLCQQYGLKGQFIADLDALTSGKLRESLAANPELSANIAEEAMGTDLRDALAKFWVKLDALGDEVEKTSDASFNDLREVIASAPDRETKRYRLLLLLVHRDAELRAAIPTQKPPLDYLSGTLAKMRGVCAEAGLHLLPHGTLENHCPAYTGLPWEITNNAKIACFDTESHFLLETIDATTIEKRYSTLIPVLDRAQGLALLDLDRHLGYAIGDWIAAVQSGVARKEITNAATLESHALIDWGTHTRLFELLHFEVTSPTFVCRLKLTRVVDEQQREFAFNQDTDHANFSLPKPNDASQVP
jgi:hypothetical protein